MRLLLDDEPCSLDSTSIAEAIAAGAAIARDQGRMVVEVFVDGQQWSAEQLDTEGLADAGADEVRLVSAHPHELASSVFSDASTALDAAEGHQSRAAEMIQAGDTAAGLREFEEALNIWISVQDAVEQATSLIDLDLEAAEFHGTPVSETLARLRSQLQQLCGQIRSEDHLGLADTLLYDLPTVLQEWRDLLRHLAEEADRT